MTRYLIPALLLALAMPPRAHAQYTGGPGGAYASASLVLIQDSLRIDPLPNPAHADHPASLRIQGARGKAILRIHAIDGRLLLQETRQLDGSPSTWAFRLPAAQGIHILEVYASGKLHRQKLILLPP